MSFARPHQGATNNRLTLIEAEEQMPLSKLVSQISKQVEIRPEHEAYYDWIAFVPLWDSNAGALTKYFGKVAGEDEYKYRGIECRQRSSPSYIDEVQKALIRAVDAYRDPEAVCEELRSWVNRLERGAVDPNELVITNRVSKKREDYTQSTRSVAALERAADLGLARAPGQSVLY
jgi:DNA polymerase, archaea type